MVLLIGDVMGNVYKISQERLRLVLLEPEDSSEVTQRILHLPPKYTRTGI